MLQASHTGHGAVGPQELGSVVVVVEPVVVVVVVVVVAETYINVPPHEKTNNVHMRKQRRRSASR